MNNGQERCTQHGSPVTRTETDAEGWVTHYADDCTLCDGEQAGLPYKPGAGSPSVPS